MVVVHVYALAMCFCWRFFLVWFHLKNMSKNTIRGWAILLDPNYKQSFFIKFKPTLGNPVIAGYIFLLLFIVGSAFIMFV